MARVLFIDPSEVAQFTNLNALVDADKFVQYIDIVQSTHIENYLGFKLYDKIYRGIENGNLAPPYTTLLSEYIAPMVRHWAMWEYLHYAPISVANKGVFKHSSEGADTASEIDMKRLINKQKDTAELFTKRFQDYIYRNSSLYPEYGQNENGKPQASTGLDYFGWVI